MAGNRKMEVHLDRAGLSRWLVDLAAGFDAGAFLPGDDAVDLEGFKSIKLSFKREMNGAVRVKLSAKYPKPAVVGQTQLCDQASPCAVASPEGGEADNAAAGTSLPKYKSLKKHMKQTFKSIGQALSAGQLPPVLEARSFIADSRLMVEYQGKGDGFYDAYRDGSLAFEAALAAEDLDGLRAAYDALAQIKRECHSRHA